MRPIEKKLKISKKTVIFMILAVFFVIIDRFLKALCLAGKFDKPISIFGDIFSLNYVKNYYISFSLPFSGPILIVIIGLIIITLLIVLMKQVFKSSETKALAPEAFPLTILIIGAILNYADRIKFGFVIDYFDLKYFTIFNLADIMICVGVILLIFNGKKYGDRKPQQY